MSFIQYSVYFEPLQINSVQQITEVTPSTSEAQYGQSTLSLEEGEVEIFQENEHNELLQVYYICICKMM